jgi:colicin import membrane protein
MKLNIARNIGLGLALCLTVSVTGTAIAQQGKGNANRTAAEERENQEEQETREKNQNAKAARENQKDNKGKDKQEREQRDRAQAQKGQSQQTDNAGKGNAYGQNKGELSGREFGQNRAAEARLTGEQRRAELATTVDEGDIKIKEAKDKIAKAKNELETKRKARKISDAELAERRSAIERAEVAVRVLEEKVNAGRIQVTIVE